MAPTSPPTRDGVVLCGGRSRRMHRPKALLPWHGRTLVEHTVATLSPVVDEVIVVGSADLDLPPLAARVIVDREPHRGPLAALRDALEVSSADLVFVAAADTPQITPSLTRTMLDLGTTSAFERDGFVHPLPAVYSRSLLPRATELLEREDRGLMALLDAAEPFRRCHEIEGFEPERSFNTPDGYLAAVEQSGWTDSVRVKLVLPDGITHSLGFPAAPLSHILELATRRFERHAYGLEDHRMRVELEGRVVEDERMPIAPGEGLVVTWEVAETPTAVAGSL